MSEQKKALVVGAGFAGAVVARELADNGWKVLVIDKRNHIAGNAYDFINEDGIRVHKYGPHLWHGNSEIAQEWVSRFTEWVPYKHYVEAQLPDGRYTPLPINTKTMQMVFGGIPMSPEDMENRDTQRAAVEEFMDKKRVKHATIENSRQHVEASVGTKMCELFFAPYTKKMWGMDLSELPASVAARIPTKTDDDKFYFPKDKYQCLPAEGYTKMFENIFDHPNITVALSTSRQELPQFHNGTGYVKIVNNWEDVKFDAVFSSEPIDTYYNCDIGELPWRSIKFHTVTVPLQQALPAPVVNFTHDGPHTRVTEWKQLPAHGGNPYKTTLTFEEPCDYKDNNFERYYPVKTAHAVDPNRERYKKYRERAKADGIHFIGRCGRYAYLDMSPCVNSTLTYVRKFLAGETDIEE